MFTVEEVSKRRRRRLVSAEGFIVGLRIRRNKKKRVRQMGRKWGGGGDLINVAMYTSSKRSKHPCKSPQGFNIHQPATEEERRGEKKKRNPNLWKSEKAKQSKGKEKKLLQK
ncbi:hypothetical protein V6N13_071650 [Hibiscus sabdariffa]|uniref:Uncharacterized protein n=1 Tax=Hibiscus sabdariffa TaxID=183260 RepID=A0ABR2TCW8_9ROSI